MLVSTRIVDETKHRKNRHIPSLPQGKWQSVRRVIMRWGWLCLPLFWLGCGSASGPGTAQPINDSPFQTPKSSELTAAISTASPTVEEADLYRTRDNLLFYFHKDRGLTIFDLSVPKQPRTLASVPVFGTPVEMFVDQKIAYLLVMKPFQNKRSHASQPFLSYQAGSQLITIAIDDPASPKILGKLAIEGELKRGQSRKVGDMIYLLSHEPKKPGAQWNVSGIFSAKRQVEGAIWLWGINVSQPATPKVTQQKAIENAPTAQVLDAHWPQNTNAITLRGVEALDFHGVVMTATAGRLLVTERWSVQASLETTRKQIFEERRWQGCGGSATKQFENETIVPFQVKLYYSVVNVLDLNGQNGKTPHLSRFVLAGVIGDQFKQSIVVSPDAGTSTYYGIVQRNQLVVATDKITNEVKNVISTVAIAHSAAKGESQPKLLSSLAFGKPGETVRGSYFDHQRFVAYAITADGDSHIAPPIDDVNVDRTPERREVFISRDPLYAIDLRNPAVLKKRSEIDGLSGDVNLFRPITGGGFLLAVGRDTSPSCTGFDKGSGFSRTSVSLIDVQDLDNIKLVQRRCVEVKPGIQVTSSEVNWDRDQAHKGIGLYMDDTTQMVSVPVTFSVTKDNQEETRVAVGLMQWDLSKYDPNLPPEKQQVLENLGTVLHPSPALQRTILMKLPQGGAPHLAMVNLSDAHLTITGLMDPIAPQHLAAYEISPYIDAIYRFGDYLVEVVLTQRDKSTQTHLGQTMIERELRIRPWKSDALQAQPVEHTLSLGNTAQILRWGDYLLVFRTSETSHTKVEIWNLQDPQKPQMTGQTSLETSFSPALQSDFNGAARGIDQAWQVTKQGLIYVETAAASAQSEQFIARLHWLDLTDPATPTIHKLQEYRLPGTAGVAHLFQGNEDTWTVGLTAKTQGGALSYQAIQWQWKETKWQEMSLQKLPGRLLQRWEHDSQSYLIVALGSDLTKVEQIALLALQKETGYTTIVDTLAWSATNQHDIHFSPGKVSLRLAMGIKQYAFSPEGFALTQSYNANTSGFTIVKVMQGGMLMRLDRGGLFMLYDGSSLKEDSLSPFVPTYQELESTDPKTRKVTKSMTYPYVNHFVQDGQKLWIAAGGFGILAFDMPDTRAP